MGSEKFMKHEDDKMGSTGETGCLTPNFCLSTDPLTGADKEGQEDIEEILHDLYWTDFDNMEDKPAEKNKPE